MKRTLVMVTRIDGGAQGGEFKGNWRSMEFGIGDNIIETKDMISEAVGKKVEKEPYTLAVLDGDQFPIAPINNACDWEKLKPKYRKNSNAVVKSILSLIGSEGTTLIAIHWHDTPARTTVQFFYERLKEKLSNDALEKLKIVSYSIGGTQNNVSSQIQKMVESLQTNLQGFEEAFEELWSALKGSQEINFFLHTLLSRLKLIWCDLDQNESSKHEGEVKNIINTFYYLLKGQGYNKNELVEGATNILAEQDASTRNLEKFILSDLSWKDDASKELDALLNKLNQYAEAKSVDKNMFVPFCCNFSTFLNSITTGRKEGLEGKSNQSPGN